MLLKTYSQVHILANIAHVGINMSALVYTYDTFVNPRGASMDFKNIDEIRAYFADDEFANKCLGARIDDYDFETGVATASMTIDDRHHNAQGFVMGGVFFSLADYALAVSSNVNQPPSASTNASMAHMRRAKGSTLTAVASPDKLGRNLAFFTVDIFDEPGNLVARMSATVMRTEH